MIRTCVRKDELLLETGLKLGVVREFMEGDQTDEALALLVSNQSITIEREELIRLVTLITAVLESD